MKSALTPYLDKYTSRKGFRQGREGGATSLGGDIPQTMMDSSLETLTEKAKTTTRLNGVPIVMTDDQDGIPVRKWHSHAEVVEAIREWIEFEDEIDEEQAKIDDYDRAMSIL